MIFNKDVNFTKDPKTCKPSTGLTCTYCKNERNCQNKLPRNDMYGYDSRNSAPVSICADDDTGEYATSNTEKTLAYGYELFPQVDSVKE